MARRIISSGLVSLLTLILSASLIICGCKASAKTTDTTQTAPVAAGKAADAAVRADDKLANAQPVIESMTPANVAEKKPEARALVSGARADLQEAKTAATQAKELANKDQATINDQGQQIQDLKKANPLRTYMLWAAGIAFTAAVAFVLLAVFLKSLDQLIAAGLCAFAGGAFYWIAEYLREIGWVIGAIIILAAVAAAVVIGRLLWKVWQANDKAEAIAHSIEAAKDAGVLTISDAAAAVLNAVQGPAGAKGIVDKVQAKVKKL